MISKKLQGGYSMLELVIYLALFIGISIIIITSLVTVMRTYATAAAYRKLQTNGELVMERIVREVRGASDIDVANSTFDNDSGVLTISSIDQDDVSHTISFSVSSGKVAISDNAQDGFLSTDEVTVESLIFRQVVGGSQDAVKVELTLSTASGYIKTASFYTTAVARTNP